MKNRIAILSGTVLLGLACSREPTKPPLMAGSWSIPEVVVQAPAGNKQTGQIAAALGDSLAIRVLTRDGMPVEGVIVQWHSTDSLAVLSPTAGFTGRDGVAKARWTLGVVPGEQTAVATVIVMLAQGRTFTFAATALPGFGADVTAPARSPGQRTSPF